MRFISFFRYALRELGKNSVRSGLTMLGIIIGVSSFIIIVGIIQSSTVIIKNKVYTYGTNAISITTEGKEFSVTDCFKLKLYIHDIKFITPLFSHPGLMLKYKNKSIASRVYGSTDDFFLIKDWDIVIGRKFSDIEMDSFQKVAVIGNTQKTILFGQTDPIGRTFHLNGTPFRVIGVLETVGKALSGRDFDNIVVIPYTTMGQKITINGLFREILVSVSNAGALESTVLMIRNYFSNAHNVPIPRLTYIKTSTSKEMLEMADGVINILGILLGLATFISLVVGGINIMNIMLAAVTERTREIGIRLAVGAKSSDIMNQFILESAILSSIGGIIGIILGISVNVIIVYLVGWPFMVSILSIIVSFVFSCAVGILFGYHPARLASRMIPVDALNS